MLCAVRCVIIICFSLLFSNYSIYVFFIYLNVCTLFCIYVFNCVFYIFVYFLFCILLFFPNSLQVYRPLPPGGTPVALDKCHIITFLYKNNNSFILKNMLLLPIPTHRRGLKVRHFVLSVYKYIYI